MTDPTAVQDLKIAHDHDWAIALDSQKVHELWGEIDAQSKRIAELDGQLKEAVQYEVLAKVRAGEGSWTPLKKESNEN